MGSVVLGVTLLSGMVNSSANTFLTCAWRSAFLAAAAEAIFDSRRP